MAEDDIEGPSDQAPQSQIFILDVGGDPVTLVGNNVIFTAGSYPLEGNRRRLVGVSLVYRFILRTLEEFDIFHIHGSAAFHVPTRTLVLLLGPARTGKSLLLMSLLAQPEFQIASNSYVAFTLVNDQLAFFRGSPSLLVRKPVVDTARHFFRSRQPLKTINMDGFPDATEGEVRLVFDANDKYVETYKIKPGRIAMVWPEIGGPQNSEKLANEAAVKLLSGDMSAFWTHPVEHGWGAPGWLPWANQARSNAYEELVAIASGLFHVSGKPDYMVNAILSAMNTEV